MKSYRVSTIFSQRELLEFLDHNLNINVTIEAMLEEQGAVLASTLAPNSRHQDTDAIYTPERGSRRKRTSKVNEAILNVLRGGAAAHPNALKAALSNAGMSENSLSTGLSILQKAGVIKRDDEGMYYLSVKEAAE